MASSSFRKEEEVGQELLLHITVDHKIEVGIG